MNSPTSRARFVGALAVAAIVALSFSTSSSGYAATKAAKSQGNASFLSGSTAPPTLTAPPTSPPQFGTTSSSVLNQPNPVNCSATADPAVPTLCSAGGPFQNQRCSVQCDGDADCSVFDDPNGGDGMCSTFGDVDNFCSVVQPGLNIDDAYCSAFSQGNNNGSQLACSANASAGGFQVCSAQQGPPPQFQNQCSAFNWGQSPANIVLCSVTNYGARKGACTTFQRGAGKECSALSSNSFCSVAINPTNGQATGKCTALRQADQSSCSAAPGFPGTVCSVYSGTNPNPNDPFCGFH